jgi:hypothetical protein
MSRKQTIEILQTTMTLKGGAHPLGQHIRTAVAAEHVRRVMEMVRKHEKWERERGQV